MYEEMDSFSLYIFLGPFPSACLFCSILIVRFCSVLLLSLRSLFVS